MASQNSRNCAAVLLGFHTSPPSTTRRRSTQRTHLKHYLGTGHIEEVNLKSEVLLKDRRCHHAAASQIAPCDIDHDRP